jgi:hypothetical protein
MLFTRRSIPTAARAFARFFLSLFANDKYTLSTPRVRDVRAARCTFCPHFARESAQCTKCTCVVSLKTLLATERCPDQPPRWKEQTKFSSGL